MEFLQIFASCDIHPTLSTSSNPTSSVPASSIAASSTIASSSSTLDKKMDVIMEIPQDTAGTHTLLSEDNANPATDNVSLRDMLQANPSEHLDAQRQSNRWSWTPSFDNRTISETPERRSAHSNASNHGSSRPASPALIESRASATVLMARVFGCSIATDIDLEKIINGTTLSPVSAADFLDYAIKNGNQDGVMFLLAYHDYARSFGLSQAVGTNGIEEMTVWTANDIKIVRGNIQRAASVASAATITVRQSVTETIYDGPINITPETLFAKANNMFGNHYIHQEEVARILSTFILEGAHRELNISSRERKVLIAAIKKTTHPSIFQEVVATVMSDLQHNLVPEFLEAVNTSANPARQRFDQGLGLLLILVGGVALALITAYGLPRAFRWLALLPLVLGGVALFLAYYGICVLLHAFGSYQVPARQGDAESQTNERLSWIRRVFSPQRRILEPTILRIHRRLFWVGFGVSFVVFLPVVLFVYLYAKKSEKVVV